jgi:SnoaL-like domain
MADSASQITALVHRYCELFDTGQFDEFAAQFEHGQWHRADPGAAAARRWIDDHVHLHDGLPRTKHLTTNLIVEVDEGPVPLPRGRTSPSCRRCRTSRCSRSSPDVTGTGSRGWTAAGGGRGAR